MIELTPFIIGGVIGFCVAGLLYFSFHAWSERHWVDLLRKKEKQVSKYKSLYELHKPTQKERQGES